MTNEPEWVEKFDEKYGEEVDFGGLWVMAGKTVGQWRLVNDEVKTFIKEEKEKSYRDGCKDTDKQYGLYAENMNTALFEQEKETTNELLSKIEEEVKGIEENLTDVERWPVGERKRMQHTIKKVLLSLSKYKV